MQEAVYSSSCSALTPHSFMRPRPRPRPFMSPNSKPKAKLIRRDCGPSSSYKKKKVLCQIELKPPPYPTNALEPYISRESLEYHWSRHHRGHVHSLNKQIAGTDLDDMPLEDIILASYNKGHFLPSFNHAAQIWNHDFFWQSMKPGGGGRPSGQLLQLIERDFGSLERMLMELKAAASTQFGSGWAWLVYKANKLDVGNAVNPLPSEKDNKLVVAKTPNAVNPLVWDYSPLLAIDVWEHAYYLDYEHRRVDYVSTFLEKLVSWEAVSSRLEMAMQRAAKRAREEKKRMEEDDMIIGDKQATEVYLNSDEDSETE
ncbi:superoxide dismutase Fe-Mn family protein [Dioscorea alata]|uniref:Superoxide dismutase Fe-Mn family protein n=2 Tax=Dioscorea alata TaxID=55571 RepID=A0ACB7UF51_DIOAL|nr:superoxide dismutase Fe-Mn family protein [Dioscorea alata]KAH7658960.1 superoxide dismutase Fe-Mn family protein [Dioscorea alata]